jgi:NADH-quinone oxidoreductase subunit A
LNFHELKAVLTIGEKAYHVAAGSGKSEAIEPQEGAGLEGAGAVRRRATRFGDSSIYSSETATKGACAGVENLQTSDYGIVAVLLVTALALTGAMLLVAHLLGPRRHGTIKEMPYESGVNPVGEARKRFNVRFYLVAVLFLVFDVEIIFLYPWAVIFPRLHDSDAPAYYAQTIGALAADGYGIGFFLVSVGIFFALLTVGFIYEWRKGLFQWN